MAGQVTLLVRTCHSQRGGDQAACPVQRMDRFERFAASGIANPRPALAAKSVGPVPADCALQALLSVRLQNPANYCYLNSCILALMWSAVSCSGDLSSLGSHRFQVLLSAPSSVFVPSLVPGCCSSQGGATCCSSSYQGCGTHYSPGSGRPGVSIHSSGFWIGILWVGLSVVWHVVPTLCRTTSTSGHSSSCARFHCSSFKHPRCYAEVQKGRNGVSQAAAACQCRGQLLHTHSCLCARPGSRDARVQDCGSYLSLWARSNG